ncbi:hypothetical protein A6J80_02980 [Paracoccus yeei]|uniref:Transposase n=1 Tax=Paracoccus yeei TaxID=147645 RepID=A0A1V0GNR8_9RHOB|nr:hypothetical protein A6J80_02980 [Paracoccus yeei]
MSNLYWLSDAQMERLKPFFPKSHGKPRVDDRRVLIMVGLAAESADHKTIMIDATYLKAHRTASSLRAWAAQVARRRGRRRAMVALARRIGVILHRMWRDGTVFWIEPSVTSHAA